MSATSALFPQPSAATHALLLQRLQKVHTSLLVTRAEVLKTLDHELSELRGWLENLQTFDPSVAMHKVAESSADPTSLAVEQLIQEAPHADLPEKVVQLTSAEFAEKGRAIEEAMIDPKLEKATVAELNAALQAAFHHMAEAS
jgi:hypothetical protein